MLVRDELDVIEANVRHLSEEVDEILVADHLSTDGTFERLSDLAEELPLILSRVEDPGYRQAEYTSALAREALGRGHKWVVPTDADEWVYSPHGRIGDVLAEVPRELLFANAVMFNHIPTDRDDPTEADPFRRIGWRFVDQGAMAKVACRTSPDLQIDMGNHAAVSSGRVRSNWQHTAFDLLVIRHFPWRAEAQLQRKIANGARAYAAAPDLDPTYGEHWKAFGNPDEDASFGAHVSSWFWEWGYRANPGAAGDLIFDPAPRRGETYDPAVAEEATEASA